MANAKFSDAMLDIETLSTESNAVVLSIGVALFNLTELSEPEDLPVYLVYLNLDDQLAAGRHISAGTVLFWMQQNDEAREKITKTRHKASASDEALKAVFQFMKRHRVGKVWGNGNTFDNTIIRSLAADFDVDYPVAFWADLDLRTLAYAHSRSIGQEKPWRPKPVELGLPDDFVKHHAVDDALYQALLAQRLYAELCYGTET